jgi:hypothetical protein
MLFWNVSGHFGLVQSVSGYFGPFWTISDCFGLFQASLGLFWEILAHFLLISS